MSEKRQRQQQRRQRRKAQARSRGTHRRSSMGVHAEIAKLNATLADIASRDAGGPADALEAEHWASEVLGTMQDHRIAGEEVPALLLPGFIDALEALGTPESLATLRAVAAVTAPAYAGPARAACERLVAAGMPEPAWSNELGRARPTAAALVSDETFDDGVSVMVEFAAPGVETHTLGIYVDHNLGGLVKDVFLAGPLAEIGGDLARAAAVDAGLTIRGLGLAEARARVDAALSALDHTWDPPVSEDVRRLRALIDARMRLLPDGFELPDPYEDMAQEAREARLADFLTSPEGRRWHGDEDAEDVAALAIDFGADYNHGGPLRWSPVVVEIFMTSWLARKVLHEPGFFERVPDVLRDWVTYAGRRRGVPADKLAEAVAAVDACRADMLVAVRDHVAWGPAKVLAMGGHGARSA